MKLIYFIIFLNIFSAVAAQKPTIKRLDLETIMQGKNFIGYSPENPIWSLDNQQIFFKWNPQLLPAEIWYKIDIKTWQIAKVEASDGENLAYALYVDWNYDEKYEQIVWSQDGDLYIYGKNMSKPECILSTPFISETNPQWLADGMGLAYTAQGNIYHWNRATNSIKQMTFFEKNKPTDNNENKEYKTAADWLNMQQISLFEYTKDARRRREFSDSIQKSLFSPNKRKSGDHNASNLRISPKLDYAVYQVVNQKPASTTIYANYMAENGFSEAKNARAKVGFYQYTSKLGIYEVKKDSYQFISSKNLKGIYEKPSFMREYHRKEDTVAYQPLYKAEKPTFVAGYRFNRQGDLYADLRSCDNKQRWICLVNKESREFELLDYQQDSAWVGGEGIEFGQTGWVDNNQVWFISNETDFPHIYTVNIRNGEKKVITKGKFEVSDVYYDEENQHFYYHSSKKDAGERHFYRYNVRTSEEICYTNKTGGYEVSLSPDKQHLLMRYSNASNPWELFYQKNSPLDTARQLTWSQTEQFKAYKWQMPTFISFNNAKNQPVSARLYRPNPKNDAKKAVLFVHGAGYLQNAHKWWSVYFREYMFHQFLTERGYTVLDVDYHGSAGYGSSYRTSIYRNMGGADLDDYVSAASYLTKTYQIKADKIGIYGGSYGGFITLMALFKYPQTFACGAALRSVTDWAHYNHGYTSNILNTPVEDSLAFVRSSPIYHAAGLQKPLLMLHGAVDDNVQYQDVVRLAQKLIELKKERWELAVYPVEAHGFTEAASWLDEYRRIFELFERYL